MLEQELFALGKISISWLIIIQIILIVALLKLFVFFLDKALSRFFRARKVDEGRAFTIIRFVNFASYFIALLLIIHSLGMSVSGLLLGSAGLLVGIGLGLQRTFSDFMSGVILLIEGDIQVGDQVEIGTQIGTIRSIGWRTCKIQSVDEKEHIFPNSKMISEEVVNLSLRTDKSRFAVEVGVAYGTDPELVKKVLLECAKEHPTVSSNPSPVVFFSSFGDSSLNFKLMFFTHDYMKIQNVKSDLRFAITRKFKDQEIEIPFPQRDVWVRTSEALEAT